MTRVRRAVTQPGVRIAVLVAAGLLGLPYYLRFFAWALGTCGVQFWAPRG